MKTVRQPLSFPYSRGTGLIPVNVYQVAAATVDPETTEPEPCAEKFDETKAAVDSLLAEIGVQRKRMAQVRAPDLHNGIMSP